MRSPFFASGGLAYLIVWEWRADVPKKSATTQANQAAAEKDHRVVLMEWKDAGNCVLIAASEADTLPIVKTLSC
jgi:hypothetical protein